MNQGNQQQDTFGQPGSPVDTQGADQSSFDSLMFGEGNVDPFSGPVESTAPVQGPPVTPEGIAQQPGQAQPGPQAPSAQPGQQQPVDNDKVRFEYWQSQAAKYRNQLQEMQQYMPLIEQIKENPAAVFGSQNQQGNTQPTDQGEQLPPLPARPTRPSNYSRAEAIDDPDSASARYELELQEYEIAMGEYNVKRVEGLEKQLRARDEAEKRQLEEVRQQEAQRQAMEQQMNDVQEYVKVMHSFTDQDAQDFVQTMMSGESMTMENLVTLYKLHKGQPVNPAVGVQPSPAFQQAQRAAAMPTPMSAQTAYSSPPVATGEQAGASLGELMAQTWQNENPF